MQGRSYYLTTLLAWQNEITHFSTSHYIHAEPNSVAAPETKILVIVEADEGAHNRLSQDPAWQEFPHPLSSDLIPKPIAEALSAQGVTPFNTTFEAIESVAKSHPFLRHRVF